MKWEAKSPDEAWSEAVEVEPGVSFDDFHTAATWYARQKWPGATDDDKKKVDVRLTKDDGTRIALRVTLQARVSWEWWQAEDLVGG